MATYLSLTNELLREMNEVALTSSTFANAIGVAYDMVKYEFLNELMQKTLKSTKYLEKKL